MILTFIIEIMIVAEQNVKKRNSFLENIRKLHAFEIDTFSFFVDEKEIKFPLFKAISKSSKITKILSQDNTIRSLRINQTFRSNIAQDKIIEILTSKKANFRRENRKRINIRFCRIWSIFR